jgi:hypothetical protein
VDVKNEGNTAIPAGTDAHITDRTSDNVTINDVQTVKETNKPVKFVQLASQASSGGTALLLDSNGSLWTYGQMGVESPDYSTMDLKKVTSTGSTRFVAVSYGFPGYVPSAYALDENGNIWVWGGNDVGQLGTGTTDFVPEPTKLTVTEDGVPVVFKTISTQGNIGPCYLLAIDAKGHLWKLTSPTSGSTTVPAFERVTDTSDVDLDQTFASVVSNGYLIGAIDTEGSLWTNVASGWDGTSVVSTDAYDQQFRLTKAAGFANMKVDQVTVDAQRPGLMFVKDVNGNVYFVGSNGPVWPSFPGALISKAPYLLWDASAGNGKATSLNFPTLQGVTMTLDNDTLAGVGSQFGPSPLFNNPASGMNLSYDPVVLNTGTLVKLSDVMMGNAAGQRVDSTSVPMAGATPQLVVGGNNEGFLYLDKDGGLQWSGYPFNKTTYRGAGGFESTPQGVPAQDITRYTGSVRQIAQANTVAGYTDRTYALGTTLQPGESTTYEITGTLYRPSQAQADADARTLFAINQSWFDSPDTPYQGIGTPSDSKLSGPLTRSTMPAAPTTDADKTLTTIEKRITTPGGDPNGSDVTGVLSCQVEADYTDATYEHSFPARTSDATQPAADEDSCGQYAFRVAVTPTPVVLGSLSGMVWEDETSHDGLRQVSETEWKDKFAPVSPTKVVLQKVEGTGTAATYTDVAQAMTDATGNYKFENLPLTRYRVVFAVPQACVDSANSSVAVSCSDSDAQRLTTTFTKMLQGTDKDIDSDAGNTAAVGMGVTGAVELTAAAPDATHVDAGVFITNPTLSIRKYVVVPKDVVAGYNGVEGATDAASVAANLTDSDAVFGGKDSEIDADHVGSSNVWIPLDKAARYLKSQKVTVKVLIHSGPDEGFKNFSVSDVTDHGAEVSGLASSCKNLNIESMPISTFPAGMTIACTGSLTLNAGTSHQDTVTASGTAVQSNNVVTVSDTLKAVTDSPLTLAKGQSLVDGNEGVNPQIDLTGSNYSVVPCEGATGTAVPSCTTTGDTVDVATDGQGSLVFDAVAGRDSAAEWSLSDRWFKVVEDQAPDGYMASTGYWLVHVGQDPTASNDANAVATSVVAKDGADLSKVSVVTSDEGVRSVLFSTTDPVKVKFTKVSGADGSPVAGAEFKLCVQGHEDEAAACVNTTSASDGTLDIERFPGLDGDGLKATARTYTLTETLTPSGFVAPKATFLVTYPSNAVGWQLSASNADDADLLARTAGSSKNDWTIANRVIAGLTTMPKTGSRDLLIAGVVALIVGAGLIWMMLPSKKSHKKDGAAA